MKTKLLSLTNEQLANLIRIEHRSEGNFDLFYGTVKAVEKAIPWRVDTRAGIHEIAEQILDIWADDVQGSIWFDERGNMRRLP